MQANSLCPIHGMGHIRFSGLSIGLTLILCSIFRFINESHEWSRVEHVFWEYHLQTDEIFLLEFFVRFQLFMKFVFI